MSDTTARLSLEINASSADDAVKKLNNMNTTMARTERAYRQMLQSFNADKEIQQILRLRDEMTRLAKALDDAVNNRSSNGRFGAKIISDEDVRLIKQRLYDLTRDFDTAYKKWADGSKTTASSFQDFTARATASVEAMRRVRTALTEQQEAWNKVRDAADMAGKATAKAAQASKGVSTYTQDFTARANASIAAMKGSSAYQNSSQSAWWGFRDVGATSSAMGPVFSQVGSNASTLALWLGKMSDSLKSNFGIVHAALGAFGGYRIAETGRLIALVADQLGGGAGGGAGGLLASLGGLSAGTVAAIGAFAAISTGLLAYAYALKKGIPVLDQMYAAQYRLAGNLTDTAAAANPNLDINAAYAQNKQYAGYVVPQMRLTAAKYGMSQEGIDQFMTLISTRGIAPTGATEADMTGQLEKMALVMTKIKNLTAGQNSSIQLAQEMRAVMEGTTRNTDQFAQMLERTVGPQWKSILRDSIEAGKQWDLLASVIPGTAAQMEDAASLLSAKATLMGEQFNQIWAEVAKSFYEWLKGPMDWINERLAHILASLRGTATFDASNAGGMDDSISTGELYYSGSSSVTNPSQSPGTRDMGYQKWAKQNKWSYTHLPKEEQRAAAVDRWTSRRSELDMRAEGLTTPEAIADATKRRLKADAELKTTLESIDKKGASAAAAAERSTERIRHVIEQASTSYLAFLDTISGSAGGKQIDQIFKQYETSLHALRNARTGAKGDTTGLAEATAALNEQLLVQIELADRAANSSFYKNMGSVYSKVASMTGNPDTEALSKYFDIESQLLDLENKRQAQDKSFAAQQKRHSDESDEAYEKRLGTLTLENERQIMLFNTTAKMLEQSKQQVDLDTQRKRLDMAGEYAKLTGNARGYYEAQVKILENQIAQTDDLQTQMILWEKRERMMNKATMNVSGLIKSGLQDYAVKTYDQLADSIGNYIPNALDTMSTSISQNLTDMITGAKSAQQAWQAFGQTMYQALLRAVIEIGMLIVKMQILSALGYEAGDAMQGIGSVNSGSRSSRSGGGGSDSLMGYGKKGLDLGKNLFGSDEFSYMEYESLGEIGGFDAELGSMADAMYADEIASGLSPELAESSALSYANSISESTAEIAASGSGMMGALGAGAGAGGIGYMAGNMIWPNHPEAGYAGAAAGLIGGAAASMTGVGASVGAAMGISAGLASTGIGALVAIPVALLAGGLMGGETKKTTPTGQSGITINMMTPGATNITGWQGMRTVTSGMFGSSSTSHFKQITAADPELTKQWNEGMLSATNSLEAAMDQLMIPMDKLDNFTFPIEFDINADNMDDAIYNISNAMAEFVLTNSGLKNEFDSVRKSGEMYIDELKRLGEAYNKTAVYAEIAGTTLEAFTGTNSIIGQSNAMSQLSERLGGYDQVQNMFNLSAKYSRSPEEQAQSKMMFYGRAAGASLGNLRAPGVNVENFWDAYSQSLQRPMSDDERKKWYTSAQQVDAFYQSVIEFATEANDKRIALLQKENTVLSKNLTVLQSSVNLWDNLRKKLANALDDIKLDSNLSALSPTEQYQYARSKFLNLSALAKGGDTSAADELASFSKEFLEISNSYYGATQSYYDDFNLVSSALTSSLTLAEQQYALALQQYNATLTMIQQNESEIAQLTAANENIVASANMLAQAMQGMGGRGGAVAAAVAAANSSQEYYSSGGYTNVGGGGGGDSGGGGGGGGWDPNGWTQSTPDNTSWGQANYDAIFGSAPQEEIIWGERAAGGPIEAGGTYLTSEQGPELIRTGLPGRVFSNKDTSEMLTGGLKESLEANNSISAEGFQAMRAELAATNKRIAALTRQLQVLTTRPGGRA